MVKTPRGWQARCPGHDDRAPSLSVSEENGRLLLHCHAGCDVNRITSALGLKLSDLFEKTVETISSPPLKPKPGRELPLNTHTPTPSEVRTIATLRNVCSEAVNVAARRGVLRCGIVRGAECWFLIDGDALGCVQARRMDGTPFPMGERAAKALTLAGSRLVPIGLRDVPDARAVLLVEGGPDLLAGYHFAHVEGKDDVAVVAVLGAANGLKEHAHAFKHKRVRVIPDADERGIQAGYRWAKTLRDAGAEVDLLGINGLRRTDGQNCKDLNDITSICCDDFEACLALWNICP